MRPTAVLLALPLLWACDEEKAAMSKAASNYELTAKTEIKQGIRPYAETRYVYSEKIGGKKRELWTINRGDNYLRHWISPSGRVWVVTQGMPGPGGAASIWTRDPSANGYGPWGFHSVLPPTKRNGRLYAGGSPGEIDLDRVSVRTLGNGRSEQIRLPLVSGGESRITLVARESAGPAILARALKPGERDLLTEAVEASPHESLRLSRPVPRSPLVLWEYRDEKTGRERRILQSVEQPTYGDPNDGVLLPLKDEREVALAPASVTRTPAGRVLWFGFSKPGEPDAARLTITRYDGKVLKDVDLVKLGGYENSAEAREGLAIRDVRIRRGSRWLPIDESEAYASDAQEELEIKAGEGRVVLKLGEKIEVERLTGAAAIRPKELGWAADNVLSERTFASPNGRFRLRERRLKNGNGPAAYATTLIGDAEEGGKRIPVELWSDFHYDPLHQARVTDTGRAFLLRFDHATNEKNVVVENAALFIKSADGAQLAGIALLTDPGWFSTPAEAKANLRLDRLTVVPQGHIGTREVDSVKIPTPAEERLTLPLEDGRVWNMRIGRLGRMPSEGVYWVGAQPTGKKRS